MQERQRLFRDGAKHAVLLGNMAYFLINMLYAVSPSPLKSQSELSDSLRKAFGPSHRHRTGVALILKEKLC